jgi:hypothetical protein
VSHDGVMPERFNVAREVDAALAGDRATALAVLAALAGELLATADESDLRDLKDALGQHTLQRGPNRVVADAVLAMVRSYSIGEAADYNN